MMNSIKISPVESTRMIPEIKMLLDGKTGVLVTVVVRNKPIYLVRIRAAILSSGCRWMGSSRFADKIAAELWITWIEFKYKKKAKRKSVLVLRVWGEFGLCWVDWISYFEVFVSCVGWIFHCDIIKVDVVCVYFNKIYFTISYSIMAR